MKAKTLRQWAGLVSALLAYYVIHEGAHLLYALCVGVFKTIHFVGIFGVQVDIYRERLTDTQLGIFCLAGPVATLVAAWVLTGVASLVCRSGNAWLQAIAYYITLIMLLLDPLYLSVLHHFVGGGDMNGIALLVPQLWASIGFGVLLLLHVVLFMFHVVPTYRRAFAQ